MRQQTTQQISRKKQTNHYNFWIDGHNRQCAFTPIVRTLERRKDEEDSVPNARNTSSFTASIVTTESIPLKIRIIQPDALSKLCQNSSSNITS